VAAEEKRVQAELVAAEEKQSSYGNLGNPKAPPIVSDKDQTNVVAYIRTTFQIKGGQNKDRWLTKQEAIEVNITNQHNFVL